MKTIRSSKDINKEEILKVLEYSKESENGNYPDLTGKIIGLLILRPSLRTTASFKASILRCKGNYIDFDARYLTAGEESMYDSVQSVEKLVDLMAIRTPMTFEIKDLNANVPIVNAMAGDEHTAGALWFLYSMWKRWNYSFEGKKIGVYGQVKFSQPMISFYRVWAKMGLTFFEDSVEEQFGADEKLVNEIKENGGIFERKKLEEFIGDVDALVVTEGRPGEGADSKLVESFNQKYIKFEKEIASKLKENATWTYITPRQLTNGELTVLEEMDNDPKLVSEGVMMDESTYVNMGIFKWLLE